MNIPTEYLPIVISFIAFLLMLLIIAGVVLYARRGAKKQALLGRIKQKGKDKAVFETAVLPTQEGGWVQNRVLGFLGMLGRRAADKETTDLSKLRPLFLKAGLRHENAPAIFWGAKILFACILPTIVFIYRIMLPGNPLTTIQMVVLLTILAISGFYLPNFWIKFKIARRRETILKGFPDALDLMVVCVEAGMGLDAAITRVAKEIELDNKILSDELNLYNLEMRAGKLRKDALRNLAMRTDVAEVDSLVTLLIQTDKFGTSIGQALKVYSDTFRTQNHNEQSRKDK